MKKTEIRSDISIEEIRVRESKEKRKAISDRIRAIRLALEGQGRPRILNDKENKLIEEWLKDPKCSWIQCLDSSKLTRKNQGRIS